MKSDRISFAKRKFTVTLSQGAELHEDLQRFENLGYGDACVKFDDLMKELTPDAAVITVTRTK